MKNDLASLQFGLPFRTDEGNKGSFGRCVVIGGCANYVGAPQFAAESAAPAHAVTYLWRKNSYYQVSTSVFFAIWYNI